MNSVERLSQRALDRQLNSQERFIAFTQLAALPIPDPILSRNLYAEGLRFFLRCQQRRLLKSEQINFGRDQLKVIAASFRDTMNQRRALKSLSMKGTTL